MTAIAVRERVYEHQPVMQAHGDFVGRIGSKLDPGLAVLEQLAEFHRNEPVIHPDIALARSELAGPPPYIPEHPLMQVLDEFLVQQIAPPAAESPVLRAGDIFL